MHLDKKMLRNLFFVAGGCVVLVWLLMDTARVHLMFKAIWDLIAPFVIGAMLAFIFNVPMRAIENQLSDIQRTGLRRGLAILITIFLLIMIITFVVELLLPQLQKTIESLVATIPSFANRTVASLTSLLEEHPEIYEMVASKLDSLQHVDWSQFIEKTVKVIGDSVSSIMGSAFSAIGNVSAALINTFVSIVFSIYCLGRKETLVTQGKRILYSVLPERWCDEIVRVMQLTNVTFSNFISGQCLEACILGGLFAVAMLIFGMPYIPLVSVIIAVTALVPVVGAFAGCVLGAFFILVDNPVQAVSFVIMFLVIQQLENNLIYPRVVGTSIGLPGMWVLVAVTIGGELMGVAGMLLMIPMASVLYSLLGEFTQKRLAERAIAEDKIIAHPPQVQSAFQKHREKVKKQKLLKEAQKDQAERRKMK